MTLIHTEAVPTGEPVTRPAEVTWTDGEQQPIPGLVTFYYRIVAVDSADNASEPSRMVSGRAFDDERPDPPTWNSPTSGTEENSLILAWASPVRDLNCLVQRSLAGVNQWENVSGWLGRGTYSFTDTNRSAGETYDYRLRVLDKKGRQNRIFNILNA